jgi:Flp pilus assembly protein TadG
MSLLADDRGSALVEFALFLSVIILLLVGVADYSFAIHEAMQVQEAASAGAAWGAIPGNESNTSGMQSAAASAATGVPGFTVNASNLWTCTPGGAAVTSSTLCTGGVAPYKYVVVKTSGTVPTPLSFPGISSNKILYGSATFRVPWSQ